MCAWGFQQEARAARVRVFEDTLAFCREHEALAAAVAASVSGTRVYQPGVPFPESAGDRAGQVTVCRARTAEAALRLAGAYPGRKIAMLNFASATQPGGGVLNGSSAQEESLCRVSSLYPTLIQPSVAAAYYAVNKAAKDVLHTDACIYSPGVVICKTDTSQPERLPQEAWCVVDVISCAAPNLRERPSNRHNPESGEAIRMQPEALLRLHEQRARQILAVAASAGVEVLVLGAFGCGAFCNDPAVVAQAYANVLAEHAHRFERVEFAIYCGGKSTANYRAFEQALAQL